MSDYAELAVTTNFSFLRGASHPEELVNQAAELGIAAIGIADRNSFAGVVRAYVMAKERGVRLLTGVRLVTVDGFEMLAYPRDRAAYGRLCRLLTRGNRRAKKGECHLTLADITDESEGQVFIALTARPTPVAELAAAAPGRVYLGAAFLYGDRAARHLAEMAALARTLNVPLVAHNDVHYHLPERQMLQDVLTCIREKCKIADAGKALAANAERHLKAPEEMARLFRNYPEAIANTIEIAEQIAFTLDELRYEYPDDGIGGQESNLGDPQAVLMRLAWEGAVWRYPDGVPGKVKKQIEHELALIGELRYAPYFLTVWDLTQFATREGILHQGRGSAANSGVCYVLGITAVDPSRMNLLFERFISTERDEPPDIDVDFEHERREEVIQYIYEKYGRHRAGLAATVITYRGKSAIRDVGKALGLSLDMVGTLAGNLYGWGTKSIDDESLREIGLDPTDRRLGLALHLARELYGFPRHLSQHVGGFVITRGPLEELIPIGNAAMEARTFVEWDKDDLDALGILKIDVLALGMLTCIAKAFALLKAHYGLDYTLATLPAEDEAVYAMLQKADSVGVFQVESRAQMSMLPRLKPKEFKDLVIEVAIVRPGPIQGDMVHPYLRRREGIEPVHYPRNELKEVLDFTLGVPLFQEQAMQIAIVAAGFTAGEADRLRRAMATFRRSGTIPMFRDKFIAGMTDRGYEQDFAARCFQQIEGFADYGFPMSHAASFALLVYVSAWLKCHYPDVFCAAILNSQPMGFYAPAQLVRDAREHGVDVRAPDVNESAWDNILEANGGARHAVRLGFRQIKGFREDDAAALVAARGEGFDGVRHLERAAGLSGEALAKLAEADAFRSLGLDRRQALWAVKGLDGGVEAARTALPALPLFARADAEALRREEAVTLTPMRLGEHIVEDYRTLRLSLKAHPLSLLRPRLRARRIAPNGQLAQMKDGERVTVAGLVLVRQRPGTAKGVIFATLEDETGIANIVVWSHVFERCRRIVLASRLLMVTGKLQKQGLVIHVVADRMADLSAELNLLFANGDACCESLARADGVRNQANPPADVPPHRHPRNAVVMPKSRDFR